MPSNFIEPSIAVKSTVLEYRQNFIKGLTIEGQSPADLARAIVPKERYELDRLKDRLTIETEILTRLNKLPTLGDAPVPPPVPLRTFREVHEAVIQKNKTNSIFKGQGPYALSRPRDLTLSREIFIADMQLIPQGSGINVEV